MLFRRFSGWWFAKKGYVVSDTIFDLKEQKHRRCLYDFMIPGIVDCFVLFASVSLIEDIGAVFRAVFTTNRDTETFCFHFLLLVRCNIFKSSILYKYCVFLSSFFDNCFKLVISSRLLFK